MSTMTHFNAQGEAHMIDVGDKAVTKRVAVASGEIIMQPATLKMIVACGHKKGDVLGIARVAGIMACKKTADLIPLCHPISLTHVELAFKVDDQRQVVECRARTEVHAQTGVEMEALIAVQVALATIYDMCKAVDRGMCITSIKLLEKSGGKSGDYSVGESA